MIAQSCNPITWRWQQKDYKSKVSLGYKRPCLKRKKMLVILYSVSYPLCPSPVMCRINLKTVFICVQQQIRFLWLVCCLVNISVFWDAFHTALGEKTWSDCDGFGMKNGPDRVRWHCLGSLSLARGNMSLGTEFETHSLAPFPLCSLCFVFEAGNVIFQLLAPVAVSALLWWTLTPLEL